jgi:three-Cys-motif partner protein
VEIVLGDANDELPSRIIPRIAWSHYERALVFLDPYNMKALQWKTIEAAGKNPAVDAIIHFPTMDANRTVLLSDRAKIRPAMAAKMTAYWGDDSWREGAYSNEGMLQLEGVVRKRSPDEIIRAFQERLRTGAGFKYISAGLPARNSLGNIVYHLLFASHNKAALKVIRSVEKAFGT